MTTPWTEIVSSFEKRKAQLNELSSRRVADIPLRYFRQQAQFTSPASDYAMLEKAVGNGFSATPKILDKFKITHADVAKTLGVQVTEIESLLRGEARSPMVMVDGEDAQALRDDVVERGRKNASRIFQEGSWGNTLRFYRPSGLNLDYCVKDFVEVLGAAGQGGKAEDYPIDGIVFPKLDHPEEMEWVCQLLTKIETTNGLAPNQIKLQFLVESGWGLIHLPKLVEVSLPRLSGIIFGIADYSASINLPHIENNHPACDLARSLIVNMAGAVGVPAIDNMTVNYPVAKAEFSAEQNREFILKRMKECFEDARHGEALGMDGKWVGHPLQLFCVLLAYRTARDASEMESEIRKIEAYHRAVSEQLGATIIEGVMSDRATDRHARQKLRKAVATGKIAADRALKLGIITAAEAAQLK
jgi:citrate lyase beta subunit